MLDLADFISDRGGNPNKIKESQRKRYAPEGVVDEVLSLYEEARRARYEVMQVNSQLNALQKEIGKKKK
ncbi:cytosolic seryl-tRNA synthetase, partial [Aspergillus brasiliensis]